MGYLIYIVFTTRINYLIMEVVKMSALIDSRLVGRSIKRLRLSRNWTQDYLADVVGYSVRNLRRIENDGTTSIDVVNTFANIFRVSAIDILTGCLFCCDSLSIIKNQCFAP